MKAVVQEQYGAADSVFELREIDRPSPSADEVLVRVAAASLHAGYYFLATGKTPVIQNTYALSETAQAMADVGAGHICGKVLINVE